ncbi:hypothetical protein DFH06DRAFT_718874 [Mycena polygramma]|nr:hypothetical protein DFH06DRAFT_718874 [Mycena polygramma]
MRATVMDPSSSAVLHSVASSSLSVQPPKPQQILETEMELRQFYAMLYGFGPCRYEFDPSAVNDWVVEPPTTVYSTVLRRLARQHRAEQGPSFEYKIFGCYKEDAPPTIISPVPPNPWSLPIIDAPPAISPWRLPLRLATSSRPIVPLLLRAQPKSAPLSWAASAQSPPDYTAVQGSNKRKAVNPPAPRPVKKSPLGSNPPQTAPAPAPLMCGIDGCREVFADTTNLRYHQQRHLQSGQRVSCSGCPATFGSMEDLHTHLSHSPFCTTEYAPQVLQRFHLQPGVIAMNPAAASQQDVYVVGRVVLFLTFSCRMALWRRFLAVILKNRNEQRAGARRQ